MGYAETVVQAGNVKTDNPMIELSDILERLAYLPKEQKYMELLFSNNWQPKPDIASVEENITT
ncbi:hypothetical protein ACXZ1K_01015 [Pedobacter sp. PWIIR3]